jgi:hypothetical protein
MKRLDGALYEATLVRYGSGLCAVGSGFGDALLEAA